MSDYGPSPLRLARLPGRGSHSEGELALPTASPFAMDIHRSVLFWLRPFLASTSQGCVTLQKS